MFGKVCFEGRSVEEETRIRIRCRRFLARMMKRSVRILLAEEEKSFRIKKRDRFRRSGTQQDVTGGRKQICRAVNKAEERSRGHE